MPSRPSPSSRPRRGLLPSLLAALFPEATRARITGTAVGLGVLAVLVWASPLSPVGPGMADAFLGLGSPQLAALQYDQAARLNPFPWIRAEALEDAAMVWAVDLARPTEARRRLERLVTMLEPGPRQADVFERIGKLYLDGEHDPEAAAIRFAQASAAAPDHARAAARLMLSARARGEAGDIEGAIELWEHVAERWPGRRAEATLARAELTLAKGDAQGALALYEQAQRVAAREDERAIARLGVTTCLERLGSLEDALAELDAADLPPEVREARADGIRARLMQR